MTITSSINNVSCFNECDGTAEVFVTGGTQPYYYLWDNASQQVTSIADQLCDQMYTVVVTDNNGCTATHQCRPAI